MKIAIIGAGGSVGFPTAFYLATEKLADGILLIDYKDNLGKQHAMDLSTAVSTMGVKLQDGNYEDMTGSDIVINAASAPQRFIHDRMEMLPKNVVVIKVIAENIKKYCPHTILITSTNPADPMNYATFMLGYPSGDPKRLLARNPAAITRRERSLNQLLKQVPGHYLTKRQYR